MRHYPIPPDTELCEHGEPRHLRTREDTPRCALCRLAQRRRPAFDPNAIDAASLAARDDLWDDEPENTPANTDGADILSALFETSGDRVARMLDRWEERQPAGILF